jgi:outer membrane protein TolC
VVEQNLVTQENLLAQGSIALGLIQVYRALGGGWQIRVTGCEPGLPPPAPPQARSAGPATARLTHLMMARWMTCAAPCK